MDRRISIPACVAIVTSIPQTAASDAAALTIAFRLSLGLAGGMALVRGSVVLLPHTTQAVRTNVAGGVEDGRDAAAQIGVVWQSSRSPRLPVASTLERIIRPDTAIRSDSAIDLLERYITKHLPVAQRPWVSRVLGRLPHPAVPFARSTVADRRSVQGRHETARWTRSASLACAPETSHAATLSEGPKLDTIAEPKG